MLTRVIEFSLNNRVLVLLGVAVAAAAGVAALFRLDVDAFPDVTPVQVQINTVVPALGPEEVERRVTHVVEQAIGGVPKLLVVRSISKFGLSQVTVTFEDGVDIYFARQQINERLGGVELPPGVERPKLGPVSGGLGEVFHYVLSSTKSDRTRARTLHDWVVRPQMRTVPGVAEVNTWGGFQRQFQAKLDPIKLLKYELTYDDVLAALERNNRTAGGAVVPRGGSGALVQGFGRVTNRDELADVVVASHDGQPVFLHDLGDVLVGDDGPVRRGAVTAQGRGEVVLGLGFLLTGENGHTVTTGLKDKLAEVEKSLPGDARITTLYDRTELIDYVIDTVRKNLFEGGLLVVAVLFAFLGSLRASLIVALAIPLSMLFAFGGMYKFGIAASLLSLGAVDFGMIVDSSVVLVENCVRKLSEAGPDANKTEVIRDAAVEVRQPTLFGELIILVVYLPILTLEGIEGKMFRPMALTVVFALLGSMVLSMTLMPALASLLLPRQAAHRDPPVIRFAKWVYAPLLAVAMRSRHAVLSIGVAALVFAFGFIAPNLGHEFMPKLSEGAFGINVIRPPGTSLATSIESNTRIERDILREFPDEVKFVWSRIGLADVATDPMGVEITDLFVTLTPREKWKNGAKTQADLKEMLRGGAAARRPGCVVLAADRDALRGGVRGRPSGRGRQVLRRRLGAPGRDGREGREDPAVDPRRGGRDGRADDGPAGGSDQGRCRGVGPPRHPGQGGARLDRGGRRQAGRRHLRGAVALPARGPAGGRLRQVAAGPGAHHGVVGQGGPIALERLAKIEEVSGPPTVNREWGRRLVAVKCNIKGRDVGSFADEAMARVAKEVEPTLPKGGRYTIEFAGEFKQMERANKRLILVGGLAVMLVVGLLYMTYKNWLDTTRVVAGLPFACVGGVLALWLRDMPFSISAGVGFVAMSGVAILDDMILVSYVRQLRRAGRPLEEAVREAALTRLRPVLMTALVASLGFVPMALSTGVGAEVQRPLATVVIGGVMTNLVMSLFVLRVLYLVFPGKRV